MINDAEHPVAWAMLLTGLDDAIEHPKSLVDQVQVAGGIDETDFRIQLEHVYAHLNRAWNGRCDPNLDRETFEQHQQRGRFPEDVPPI